MNNEKIGLVLLVLIAMAVVIGNMRRVPASATSNPTGNLPVGESTSETQTGRGPNYLLYNTPPWAFAPPVGNILPTMVAPGGIAVPVAPTGYTCFEC